MNQRLRLFDAAELAQARADAAEALTGPLAQDATYLRYGAGAFDPETGAKGASYAASAVRVVAASRLDRERDRGPAEADATVPWLLATDQVAFDPGPQDRLDVGGTVYEIVTAERDTLGALWVLGTRRV